MTGGELGFAEVSKVFVAANRTREPVGALHDVNFTIGPDESVGIIGPNGAGKSTILKLAAGVSAPSAGRISRRGHTLAVIELGAGMHPDLTGRENIDLLTSLARLGVRGPVTSAFDEIVAFSELGDVLDQPVRHYSSGMVARLAFSVASHSSPDLLLIDEVLSVGDLAFQQRCRDKVFELRGEGVTVILVSHDLALVATTCDRAILLAGGSIEMDCPSDDTIAHYLGRPRAKLVTGELALHLERSSVEAGEPIRAHLTVPANVGTTALRLEFVVPAHAVLQGDQGPSTVCGTATVESVGDEPLVVELATLDLPPGRYELHGALEDERRQVLRSDAVPFTLVGPPGPTAIRLRSTVRLDGSLLAGAS